MAPKYWHLPIGMLTSPPSKTDPYPALRVDTGAGWLRKVILVILLGGITVGMALQDMLTITTYSRYSVVK
jgi:hypothetical protein